MIWQLRLVLRSIAKRLQCVLERTTSPQSFRHILFLITLQDKKKFEMGESALPSAGMSSMSKISCKIPCCAKWQPFAHRVPALHVRGTEKATHALENSTEATHEFKRADDFSPA
jgi:hypothetical protein